MESSNRFLSRLAVYEGDFRGEEGLVTAIARIEARCNTEPSASTGVPPAVLFMREKEELRKVGSMGLLESMVADVSVQAVPPTMLVRCRGREFSVPRRCIGRRVKVLAMPSGQVRVEMAGETVAVHDLSAPGGPVVYDPAHYAEALAAKARYADADIEAAARANLELLGRLGEGSLRAPGTRAALTPAYARTSRSWGWTPWRRGCPTGCRRWPPARPTSPRRCSP